MRGLAALLAAGGTWLAITRRLPGLPRIRRLRLPGTRMLAAGAGAGALGGVLALGILAVPAAAIAIGILSASVPWTVAAARRSRETEALAAAWPDFLALLRGHLAGGASLPEAFRDAAHRSGNPLRAAAQVADEALVVGRPFDEVLGSLQVAYADPTADRVLATLAAAHRSGGRRVVEVLGTLGESVADELRLRRAHHAALTEQRLTALVALLAPWALLALTVATNPQAAEAYRRSSGAAIIAAGLLATGLGYGLARRTARLSRPPRVMR
jgi:tight adherence protein B